MFKIYANFELSSAEFKAYVRDRQMGSRMECSAYKEAHYGRPIIIN